MSVVDFLRLRGRLTLVLLVDCLVPVVTFVVIFGNFTLQNCFVLSDFLLGLDGVWHLVSTWGEARDRRVACVGPLLRRLAAFSLPWLSGSNPSLVATCCSFLKICGPFAYGILPGKESTANIFQKMLSLSHSSLLINNCAMNSNPKLEPTVSNSG